MSEISEQEVFTRFADIAQNTRLDDIEAMLTAAGIPIIGRTEVQAEVAEDVHRIIQDEIHQAGITHPPTCAECNLCTCTCNLRCVCNRTHRHTP